MQVPANTTGEMIVRGEPWELNAGYWNMPDKTSEAWRLVPRMPRFAIPRYVEVWDALPKTEVRARTPAYPPSAITRVPFDRTGAVCRP